jgi:hypothetical protein
VTLSELEMAVRDGWCAATADKPDDWWPDVPARRQCGATAVVVRRLLGGEILLADVLRGDERVARHAWNRLSCGIEIDLTAEQFGPEDRLGQPTVVDEPPLQRLRPQASALLEQRVRERLAAPREVAA